MPQTYQKTTNKAASGTEFILSTDSVDSDGDIINQDGWDLKDFLANPVCLFGHMHDKIVGTWKNVRVENNQLRGELVLAAEGTGALVDTVRSLVKQGILKATSVGFSTLEFENIDRGINFIRQKLNEVSLVAVGANREAILSTGKSFGLESAEVCKSFGLADIEKKTIKSKKSFKSFGAIPMPLSTRIKTTKAEITLVESKLDVLASGELTQDDLDSVKSLTKESEELTAQLKTLETLEARKINEVKELATTKSIKSATGVVHGTQDNGTDLLVKAATAQLMAHTQQKTIDTVLAENYKGNKRLSDVVKTATHIGSSFNPDWVGNIVNDEIVSDFMLDLAPFSIHAGLRGVGAHIADFRGASSVVIPSFKPGGALSGAYVGELGTIPVKNGVIAKATLERTKCAVIVAISEEVTQATDIERLLRHQMLSDTGAEMDRVMLSAAAAIPGVRPAGLLNGQTLTASAGITFAQVLADLRTMLAKVFAINPNARPVFVMNSQRGVGLSTLATASGEFVFNNINTGGLLGFPVLISGSVPASEVYCIDASSVAIANDLPQFAISNSATLAMADADLIVPTQDDTNAGAVGTITNVVREDGGARINGDGSPAAHAGMVASSMFQQFAIGLRLVIPSAFSLTRSGAVAGIKSVGW